MKYRVWGKNEQGVTLFYEIVMGGIGAAYEFLVAHLSYACTEWRVEEVV